MNKIAAIFVLLFTIVTTSYAVPTRSLSTGRTTIQLATAFSDTLRASGVQGFVLRPGTTFRGKAVFYISSGEFDLSTARGEVLHRGGLRFAKGTAVVDFVNFAIDTSGSPVLTASVKVNDTFVGRIPIFNLAFPALTLPLTNSRIEINSIGLTLRDEAANVLNNAFAALIVSNGMTAGTASTKFSFRRSILRFF